MSLLQRAFRLLQRGLELFLFSLDPLALLHSLGELLGRLLGRGLCLRRVGQGLLHLSLGRLRVGSSGFELGFESRVTLAQLDRSIQPRALSLRPRRVRRVRPGVGVGDGGFERGDAFLIFRRGALSLGDVAGEILRILHDRSNLLSLRVELSLGRLRRLRRDPELRAYVLELRREGPRAVVHVREGSLLGLLRRGGPRDSLLELGFGFLEFRLGSLLLGGGVLQQRVEVVGTRVRVGRHRLGDAQRRLGLVAFSRRRRRVGSGLLEHRVHIRPSRIRIRRGGA